jgi:hypothetical protein
LFSLPAGTEMFHFPAFPPHTLCVQAAVTAHDMRRGFPIRTSWDHRPVIDSPRLIADSHVLHRLPMPRHPPCALKNLTTNDQTATRLPLILKMLASTMQFSNNNPPHPAGTARRRHRRPAREPNETTGPARRDNPGTHGPVASGPNSVPKDIPRETIPTRSRHPPKGAPYRHADNRGRHRIR